MATKKTAAVLLLDPKTEIKRGWRARKDKGDIAALAESIDKNGQIHPILVRERSDGGYELIAGERRTRACIRLKRKVEARVVQAASELQALEMQFEENVARKDFDRLEIGEGLKRYKCVYEAEHPETKKGASLKKGSKKAGTKSQIAESAKREAAERFTASAARSLGVSERVVYELLEVANLPPSAKAEANSARTTKDRNRAVNAAVRQVRQNKKKAKLQARAKAANKKRRAAEKRGDVTPVKNAVQLYKGDNRKLLRGFAKGSFDLVFADPPYDLARSPIEHMARKSVNSEPVAWDKLDIGWLLRVFPLLVPGGQVLAFCKSQHVGLYEWAAKQAGFEYRGDITWWKCVAEDTLIPVITGGGLCRLRPEEIETGDFVISSDGERSIAAPVLHSQRNAIREAMVRVLLADGNTAIVTPDHRMPTQRGLVEAADLTLQDKVLTATNFPIESTADGSYSSYEFGRLAGIWMGDGGYASHRPNRVNYYLSSSKAATALFVSRMIVERFDGTVNEFDEPGSEGYRIYTHNEALKTWLGSIFDGGTSKTKRILPNVFSRSEDFRRGLVAGFCETDGNLDRKNDRWRFDQANRELLKDFAILLRSLGLPSKLRQPRMVAASSQGPRVHESHRLEFRDEINRHQNATFANEANGLCYVSVVSVEEVPGGMHTWDLSIDSASHLFAVDCGMLVHNTNPAPVHRPVYNQAAAGEKIVWLVKPGAAPYFREWKNAGTEEAHNIVRGPICMGDERLAHPAQKPEWLIEKFIKRHASRRLGTRVLDPFAGVGTTPAVCKRLKLPCVGIEKEGKYVELAEARLATVQARKRRPRKKRVV